MKERKLSMSAFWSRHDSAVLLLQLEFKVVVFYYSRLIFQESGLSKLYGSLRTWLK